MMKIRKIAALLCAAVLLFPCLAAAYSEEEDVKVITLSVTDSEGREISAVPANAADVTVTASLKNWTLSDTTARLIAAVYDKNTDRMKLLEASPVKPLQKYRKIKLDVTLSALKLSQSGAAAGDTIKVFFWDDLSGMAQLANGVPSEKFASSPKTYVTGNVLDFNTEVNKVYGDNWSYQGGWMNGGLNTANSVQVMGLLNKGNDSWWHDINKGNNWYLTSNGTMISEISREIIWCYTIGDITAGKDLTIEGSLTGDISASLYVLKSVDKVVSNAGQDSGAITFTGSFISNCIGAYPQLSASDEGRFKLTVPADEAVLGNDILFWTTWREGGVLANNLTVTITAAEPAK